MARRTKTEPPPPGPSPEEEYHAACRELAAAWRAFRGAKSRLEGAQDRVISRRQAARRSDLRVAVDGVQIELPDGDHYDRRRWDADEVDPTSLGFDYAEVYVVPVVNNQVPGPAGAGSPAEG